MATTRERNYIIWQNRAVEFYFAARALHHGGLNRAACYCAVMALELVLKATVLFFDRSFVAEDAKHEIPKLLRILGNKGPRGPAIEVPNYFYFDKRSLLAIFVALGMLRRRAPPSAPVRVWEEPITIPTYLAGDPEPNPMFYFGRGSQGAEGRVYPYPLYDTLTDKKVDKTYKIVYLENEYVRIGVLPEIGGRIFEGVDKTNGYDFIYRQHVIKPALIGLIGAWISGGVEWNIPHHHRATHVHAGPIPHRGERRRQQDGLGGRDRTAPSHALGGRLHAAARQVLSRSVDPHRQPHAAAATRCSASPTWRSTPTTTTRSSSRRARSSARSTASASSSTGRSPRRRYGGADFSSGVDVSWYKNHVARQLDLRLELRGRFLRRLRPRQAGGH